MIAILKRPVTKHDMEALFEDIAQRIEHDPQTYNQKMFNTSFVYEALRRRKSIADCGTSCCIAGHMVLAMVARDLLNATFWKDVIFPELNDNLGIDVCDVAQEAFESSGIDRGNLFFAWFLDGEPSRVIPFLRDMARGLTFNQAFDNDFIKRMDNDKPATRSVERKGFFASRSVKVS